MTIKKIRKGLVTFTASILLTLATSQSVVAGPGTLATAPLLLSTIVEPNVFFTLDDSGSMAWVNMVESGTGGFFSSSGLPLVGSYYRYYYNTDWQSDWRVLPPKTVNATWADDLWILRNHHGNKNYYNPSVTYTPWAGVKADGTPMYENADPEKIPFNPINPNTSLSDITEKKDYYDWDVCRCDLEIYLPTYYIWNDTDGDGVIEASDGHTEVIIDDDDDEMQNFANWFEYYRTREYASKAAIGRVINNTDATRMGLDVFNRGHKKDLKTMTDSTSKRELLESFYGANSSGGTPARNSFKRVGELFRTTGTNAPILPAVDGGECQQNFNILMTDGFWNGGTPSGIGNTDIDTGAATAFDGNASQSNDGGNYADSHSDTLADVAMHYYENDLRTDIDNNVPTTSGVDEAKHQHLVTYTISFGLNGTIDSTTTKPTDTGFVWPNAHAGNSQRVDDLWHAAYNARGKYLSAQNPAELEQSLGEAIADIAERTATSAPVSVNSAKLSTESVVYLTRYNTNRWQGSLSAFKIAVDPATGELSTTGELSGTAEWEAGDELNNRNFTTSPRVVLTHDGNDGVPFKWDDLSDPQKADLRKNAAGGDDDDDIAKARLEYLRGSRADEGAGNFFRERASLLGDTINSGPVFVGKPFLRWPDTAPFPSTAGERYSDFKTTEKDRDGVIYVGANDGMVHGFAESDGKELLAYIPSNLFSTAAGEGLHYLTEPNYGHRYYVDLTPSISDIYANFSGSNDWHTVLIGGQRGGGRGLYALNVTDPGSYSDGNAANTVLWEFTSDDDPDLGFTYSRPQIGMANNGRWVAIFGNGYNHTGDGKAKLFILDIEMGASGDWTATGAYKKISTGVGGTGPDLNGLATPSLADLDGNGTIDRAYAGDLEGNMWAFDLSGTTADSWVIADGTDPLFKAGRPITGQPGLSKHPTIADNSSNKPNVMVTFGTGQFLVDSDKTTTADNYFFGVWDTGDNNRTAGNLVEQTFVSGFTSSIEQTTVDTNGVVSTTTVTVPARVLTKNSVNYAGGDYGWFFKLPDTGERSRSLPIVRGDVIFFNTLIPNSDPCSLGGGSFQYAIDIETGSAPERVVVDVNGDGELDEKDKAVDAAGNTATVAAQAGNGSLDDNSVFMEGSSSGGGSGGGGGGGGGDPCKGIKIDGDKTKVAECLKPLKTGRFSWQELIQ